jgi:hypothetical protein
MRYAIAFSILSSIGLAMGVYHGYKRSGGKVGPTLGYGILGGALPFVGIPVDLAQGFGKRK